MINFILIMFLFILANFILLGTYYMFFKFATKNYEHKIKQHKVDHFCGVKDFCYISLVPVIGIMIHIWGIGEIVYYINKKEL